jgi:hypothetical protein
VYDLRLTSDEFYAMTPRHFDALMDRYERGREDNELLFGQMTAAIINYSMCHPKEPVKSVDFMPSHWAKKHHGGDDDVNKPKKMTARDRKQVRDQFVTFARAWNKTLEIRGERGR